MKSAARHRAEVGREGEVAGWRQRRAGESRQRLGGIAHGAANPRLHGGIHIRRHDIDSEVQCARRPAAPDHAGAEEAQRLDLSHRPPPSKVFNVMAII
jgi:hypothetical protein